MKKLDSLKYIKLIEHTLDNERTCHHLDDYTTRDKVISNLCKCYRKLYRICKKYIKDDCIENARKLQDELKIEQWW